MWDKFKFRVKSFHEFYDKTIFTVIKDFASDSYIVAWIEEDGDIDARTYSPDIVKKYLDEGDWIRVTE